MLRNLELLAWGLALSVPILVPRSPGRDPGRFAGEWTVAPALEMSCAIDYHGTRLKGAFELRRLTTAVNQPNRLTVVAHPSVEFFGMPVPGTRSMTVVLPLDQSTESFRGEGDFATDTAVISIAMLGEVFVTATGSVHLSAGFTGPDKFTADVALSLAPTVRVSETWRRADCTRIDGTHTAIRVR
jgi:hypothetical protein